MLRAKVKPVFTFFPLICFLSACGKPYVISNNSFGDNLAGSSAINFVDARPKGDKNSWNGFKWTRYEGTHGVGDSSFDTSPYAEWSNRVQHRVRSRSAGRDCTVKLTRFSIVNNLQAVEGGPQFQGDLGKFALDLVVYGAAEAGRSLSHSLEKEAKDAAAQEISRAFAAKNIKRDQPIVIVYGEAIIECASGGSTVRFANAENYASKFLQSLAPTADYEEKRLAVTKVVSDSIDALAEKTANALSK